MDQESVNDDVASTDESASTDDAQSDLERRFRAQLWGMEREIKRLQGRSSLLTMGLLAALAMAAGAWVAPGLLGFGGGNGVVEASRIVLVGPDGRRRGEWGVDEEGNAALSLLDLQQRERLTFSVRNAGYPGLSLSNAQGERRVALGLLPDETTSLVFADGSGVPRAVLGLVRGDAANLLLADAEGVSRVGFGLDGSGVASVILPDEYNPPGGEDPDS